MRIFSLKPLKTENPQIDNSTTIQFSDQNLSNLHNSPSPALGFVGHYEFYKIAGLAKPSHYFMPASNFVIYFLGESCYIVLLFGKGGLEYILGKSSFCFS